MKDNLNDYKPEKGAGDDDDDIADVTSNIILVLIKS